MKTRQLVLRGLTFYWRTHAAVVLGVATAVSVLAGALVVGDSVRGSLRDLVLQRLGRADLVLLSSGFFRDALARDIESDREFAASFHGVTPVVVMQGLVTNQASGQRASRVQVYGVDDRFWRFHGRQDVNGPTAREALLNQTLANGIGAHSGATVLVRLERPSAIPIESLHGRKDNVGRTVRLTVRSVIDANALGDFSLQPQQGEVRAIFVPLRRLQQDLEVEGRVNALLLASRQDTRVDGERSSAFTRSLQEIVRRRFALEDLGLTVRTVPSSSGGAKAEQPNTIAVEAAAGLLDGPRARAIETAAATAHLQMQPVLTYLANSLRSNNREVPYSLVTATDLSTIAPNVTADAGGDPPPIVLNAWTAHDLGVGVGAPLTLDYFVWEEPGRLLTRTADFRVAAVVPIDGLAADRTLAPEYPGITEARTLGDWDPPFPIDLRRVRKIDEDYWDRYRTTPKAFVGFETGRRLWQSRFGDRTSVRLQTADGVHNFADILRANVDPLAIALTIRDVRAGSLAASRGATDFGEYFTYFSFFLVIAALMLAALFFRLGLEQRAREIGLLRSVGFGHARVGRLFSAEGLVLATGGAIAGMAGAVGYGAVMMAGLRGWWSGAVGTRALTLHVAPLSLIAGAAGALAAAIVCIWWTLHSFARLSDRALLAGSIGADGRSRGRRPASIAVAAFGFGLLGATLVALTFAGRLDRTGGFFGAGSSLLTACLCMVAARLRGTGSPLLHAGGSTAVWRIGVRNAAHRPGRSVLAIAVIASATFILIAVGAFRRDAVPATDRHSGTGGYPLLVDLLLPVAVDPNSRDGREMLGLDRVEPIALEPFRVLPGDDASCLNLYEPRNPRVLGVSTHFIESNRFAFESSLATSDAERKNPWLLLNRDLGPDVVPVIADANSITYVLHKQVGDEVTILRGDRPLQLRLVAALADSIFQGELLMGETRFVRLFPEREGYRFLLADVPVDRAAETEQAIERGAGDLGADAVSTAERLAEFHTVENTYLATFQTLGGLGFLVGTIGLAAIVLRNVLERRRELALLGAVGYERRHIFTIIVAENVVLLAWGLVIGSACALVAIAPAALERGGRAPLTSSAWLLVAVFAAGLISSMAATRAALRTPLLEALRSE
jgi:putative ABC transport system permease protein